LPAPILTSLIWKEMLMY